MASHEYSPREALELLLQKVIDVDTELANVLQAAIDAGKDVLESEGQVDLKKQWRYRKTVRFSDEEALRVAISIFEAHFIEQYLFVNSAVAEFELAGLDDSASLRKKSLYQPQAESVEGALMQKRLEVELQTETRISRTDKQTVPLTLTDKELIDQQKRNLRRLSELVAFD